MRNYIKYILALYLLVSTSVLVVAQEEVDYPATENIKGKGRVINESIIKLRWAPTSPKSWLQGRNYGYSVERYTVMINNKWQESPSKVVLNPNVKAVPLVGWEELATKSDYAAVIAQAFYGDDFELNATTNDIGSIINRSSELEQRFATSVFMAEYDYKAAELAGWALTDNTTKKDEKYLYRIILNRPVKQVGDTAAIFIGFADKEELLPPMELRAKWGDKSVMLTWNYQLRAGEYHSYHVEKRSPETNGKFKRITNLPVTVLNADMQDAFYIDSLQNNNIEYSYRIIGLTSFDEESPVSNIVSGRGEKIPSCIPQIYAGEFLSENKAQISWEFKCDEIDLIDRLKLMKSAKIDGEYEPLIENIDRQKNSLQFDIEEPIAYLKLLAINKNTTQTESHPFLLQKIDSIPPAIPIGLEVVIDSIGIAYLEWQVNNEPDLRGYRILRSFADGNEKSVLTPQFIVENHYNDTLSLNLKNEKVYYSLTALDMHYNESQPCPEVVAVKPNNSTPFIPRFLHHETVDGRVRLKWLTDSLSQDLSYTLTRVAQDSAYTKILYTGDFQINTYTDEPEISGNYKYVITVTNKLSQKTSSSVPVSIFIEVAVKGNKVSGFNAYIDEKDGYIELSWKKHPKALLYRIYKAEDNKPTTLWTEVDTETNRIVDEHISPNTKYTYTILFTTSTEGLSKASSVSVDY